ncbi:MAG: hypothetical protein RBS38_04430 [Bacteroidales bacterium]|jgi:hypothetical protein|nr:hypothetical protein [Bacteroidales bacterium]
MMKRIILAAALIFTFVNCKSQEPSIQPDTLRKDALNVFMESTDYVRKEIPYVNYVRDIRDAGVYIISTSQRTGSGGYEYTYFLVGQHEFEGMRDTISFVTTPDETTEGYRQKMVRTLKMGLMRYVARTPLAQYMNISFSQPLSETVTGDKWKSWVFKGSLSSYLNGEKTYKYYYLTGNLAAAKITEKWKIDINARYNTNASEYIIDGSTVTSKSKTKYVTGLVVRSISDHWSYGGSTTIGSSSYSNKKLYYNLMPGIEYDLFPYSESTRRQMRVLYSAGISLVEYADTTIYDKIRENLFLHTLSASYEVIQKWGSIDFTLTYNNYLHDWSKNNLSLNGYFNFRIAKGLSLNFGGGASLIHDQINLVKQDLTYDEILLQRKEIATQYEYYLSFGLSYTFGSIYNNVVNPRFGNSSGGGMMIIMN